MIIYFRNIQNDRKNNNLQKFVYAGRYRAEHDSQHLQYGMCYMISINKSSEKNHRVIIDRKNLNFMDIPSSGIMGDLYRK